MTTLLTIQHDPEGKLLQPLYGVLPLLNDLFREWHLVTTMNTHAAYMLLLWKVYFMKQQGMAEARRDVIRMTLERAADNYFYCDLDRLIFWAAEYPDELRETIEQVKGNDYTVIGRKVMAFKSHPPLQQQTELMMITLVKEYCDLDMDVFAGARAFSYQAAKWISGRSTVHNAAQDIEWPLIVKGNGGSIGYVEVGGLAYESELLGIKRDREDELELRVTNLKSVLEFVHV